MKYSLVTSELVMETTQLVLSQFRIFFVFNGELNKVFCAKKIISERRELVKLCYINCSDPFFRHNVYSLRYANKNRILTVILGGLIELKDGSKSQAVTFDKQVLIYRKRCNIPTWLLRWLPYVRGTACRRLSGMHRR